MKEFVIKCPCCGKHMVWDYDICPECNWENDPHQLDNPDMRGGANLESLNEAKNIYSLRKQGNYEG